VREGREEGRKEDSGRCRVYMLAVVCFVCAGRQGRGCWKTRLRHLKLSLKCECSMVDFALCKGRGA